MLQNVVGRLRLVGLLEGISYLLLMGVAMPLKYLAGMPMAVKYTGWAHGLLFIAYCYLLFQAMSERSWSLGKSFWLFVASLVPFGTFIADKKLKPEDMSLRRETAAPGEAGAA